VSGPVVTFDHVWKQFRLGERHDSLRDLVPSLARRVMGRSAPVRTASQEFWAVKDVSFSVPPGQALGIIGPNGAGKSTTLKLLTKILRPTQGRCEVRGRVGALIEIAAGFHPDLTGRENIYLQGAIMGMKRVDIRRRLDEIIDFAGVKDFIDTQVKRYSSGMNARLGFAIAAHLDPDVLIIDEVLSVGDMAFQRKCIERMEWFKSQGISIVFVSHNLQAVAGLCDRALYLHRELIALGPPDDVIGKYVELAGGTPSSGLESDVTISAQLLKDGKPALVVSPGDTLTLRVTYMPGVDLSDFSLGFLLHRSSDQLVVYDGNFDCTELERSRMTAGEPMVVDFQFRANLTRGHYHLECHVQHTPTQRFVGRVRPAANLSVHETRTWAGVADLSVTAAAVDSRVTASAAAGESR